MQVRKLHVRKLLALTCLSLATTASHTTAEDAGLIRIEPRLFYGATVTMESGVRVWRALPPTRQMIINPTNAPVNVNVTDVRERITHNHNYVPSAPPVAGGYVNGGYNSTPGYYLGGAFVARSARHFPNRAAGLNSFRRHGHPHGRAHGGKKH